MKYIRNILPFLFFGILILFSYKSWFTIDPLASGDWLRQFAVPISKLSDIITLWESQHNLGISNVLSYNVNILYELSIYLGTSLLKLDWGVGEKLFWFFPFLLIAGASSYYLSSYIFKSNIYRLTSVLIYLTNTYIFMIVGGGQMGVAMAYALAPFVVGSWVRRENTGKWVIVFTVAISFQLMFDYRIFYISLIALGLYLLVEMLLVKNKGSYVVALFVYAIPAFLLAGLVNAYWIYPFIMGGPSSINGLNSSYTSSDSLAFFSVATFENSISLLHPNWPSNLFGKVSLMRWEFLLFPILAFCSLLFIQTKGKEYIRTSYIVMFFSILLLAGAFLAKGVNPPLGFIYNFMFEHVPGFIMFRDPTKWYVLTCLGFSILIPLTLRYMSSKFQKKYNNIIYIFIFAFILFWIIVTKEAWSGILSGTFNPTKNNPDDVLLESELESSNDISRTLWIPARSSHGYYSDQVPDISLASYLQEPDIDKLISWFSDNNSQDQLKRWGVSHVIIPQDQTQLLFLTDYKYDERIRQSLIETVEKQIYLERDNKYTHHAVFKTSDYNDRAWIEGSGTVHGWSKNSPVEYRITISSEKDDALIISEAYHPGWLARIGNDYIIPEQSGDNLLQYKLPSTNSANVIISFRTQQYANMGLKISIITVLCVILFVVLKTIIDKRT